MYCSPSDKVPEETHLFLEKLALDADWEVIDSILPEHCNEPKVLDTAYNTWMYHKNNDLRDLAGSIIEKADIPEEKFVKMRPVIADAMRKDDYKYAKFRFACALANHDPKEFTGEVIEVLQSRRDDPEEEADVIDIAKSYITTLEKE
jgi:hypothetical protein